MKWENINLQFGNVLRKIREGRCMTQEEFSAFCGISRAYYGRIERGEHSATLEICQKISQAPCVPFNFSLAPYHVTPHTSGSHLGSLFVLCPQLGQNLLVAGLPAGNPVKVAAGRFADRHTLGSKSSADVAEITFVLRSRSIFLGSQSSHIRIPPNNLNTDLACQVAS